MSDASKRTTLLPDGGACELETWSLVSGSLVSVENESIVRKPEEQEADRGNVRLRPSSFDDYIGQDKVKENLQISCRATQKRGEALDHVLLHGPPGLGKTSLANIVAQELGVGFKSTSGPVIEKPGDLAAILTSLQAKDVLFIDEIHRMPRIVEEVLYPALEDFQIDILLGRGPSARSLRIDLQPFTLIGATTRTSLLTSPLRDRFGMVLRLQFYSPQELVRIVRRSSALLGIDIEEEAAIEIAKRSRGTPRIANRILKRVRDVAQDAGEKHIHQRLTEKALALLEIDGSGLDAMDRKILSIIIEHYEGGPVGLNTVAAALGEDRDTLEDVYEPYLVQEGFLLRTARGREVTSRAYTHLGLQEKRRVKTFLGSDSTSGDSNT